MTEPTSWAKESWGWCSRRYLWGFRVVRPSWPHHRPLLLLCGWGNFYGAAVKLSKVEEISMELGSSMGLVLGLSLGQ